MHAYRNFALMILTASVLMFGLMYFNTYFSTHIWFSQTRLFMTFIMAGSMALIRLFFMLHLYTNKLLNSVIVILAVALIVGGAWLVRSQTTVDNVAWMKSMIPHHSLAILISERADITDPRVQDLAGRIIEAQRNETREMETLIAELKNDGSLATKSD